MEKGGIWIWRGRKKMGFSFCLWVSSTSAGGEPGHRGSWDSSQFFKSLGPFWSAWCGFLAHMYARTHTLIWTFTTLQTASWFIELCVLVSMVLQQAWVMLGVSPSPPITDMRVEDLTWQVEQMPSQRFPRDSKTAGTRVGGDECLDAVLGCYLAGLSFKYEMAFQKSWIELFASRRRWAYKIWKGKSPFKPPALVEWGSWQTWRARIF